jgi:hypothetical protein
LTAADRTLLEVVDVVRVPFAQFAQPPGIYGPLPGPTTRTRGLYLAGEYLHSSSIQGAMRGGEMAAAAVLSTVESGRVEEGSKEACGAVYRNRMSLMIQPP